MKNQRVRLTEMETERHWRDELDDYWKDTIWQRLAQDRQMWKQHVEANHGTLWLHNDDDDDDGDDEVNTAETIDEE